MQQPIDGKYTSTGPRSPEGKEASSRNALKHGGCATGTLILPTESIDDFHALETRWFKAYRISPDHIDDAYEAELIRDGVRTEWFSLRSERNYAGIEAQIMEETSNPLDWSDRQHHAIQRFMRYKTANANALTKSRKALEDYRKARAAEAASMQNMQARDEKLAGARARHEVYKEKNKPELSWAQQLEKMKQEAIRLGYHDDPDNAPR